MCYATIDNVIFAFLAKFQSQIIHFGCKKFTGQRGDYLVKIRATFCLAYKISMKGHHAVMMMPC